MPAAISLFDTPKIIQDLPRMQVRVSSLKSPIMLALLDTSAKTNILTASIARDLNLEYRPIQTTTSNLYARYLFGSTRIVTLVARPL
ncbi:hypothetical protein L249_7806 [Ophiocordyceps polyrhachis-furcata BCC 54312]|uniref:Uncharacterized protein n=1 Tax=Ophiocordyceps polyrhachis-furcata BCC 54312 TaxID=1330021 RepID=A0A367L0J3_9HYPO|nr:hypothetical protein L249_7806 [Ophiocordyceps polyrhachis-furcata BCC 54312]